MTEKFDMFVSSASLCDGYTAGAPPRPAGFFHQLAAACRTLAGSVAAVIALTPIAVWAAAVSPLWSPDARRIAFVVSDDKPAQYSGSNVYLVDLTPTALNTGWVRPHDIGSGHMAAWTSDSNYLILATSNPAVGTSISYADALVRIKVHDVDFNQPLPAETLYTAPENRAIIGFKLIQKTGGAIVVYAPVTTTGSGPVIGKSGTMVRVNLERGTTETLIGSDTVLGFDIGRYGETIICRDRDKGLVRIFLRVPIETRLMFGPDKVTGRNGVMFSPVDERCLIYDTNLLDRNAPLLLANPDAGTLLPLKDTPDGILDFASDGRVRCTLGRRQYFYNAKNVKWKKQKHPAGAYANLFSPISRRGDYFAYIDQRGLIIAAPTLNQEIAAPVTASQAVLVTERLIASERFDQTVKLTRQYRAVNAATVSDEQAAARLLELEAYAHFRLNDIDAATYALQYALLTYPIRTPPDPDASPTGLPFNDALGLTQILVDKGAGTDLLSGVLDAQKLEDAGKFTVAGKYYEKLLETTGDPLLQAGLAFRRGLAYLKARRVLPAAKAFNDAAQQPAFPQADLAEAMMVCCQWLHPDPKWQRIALQNAEKLSANPPPGPRSAILKNLKTHFESLNRRQTSVTSRPLEVIIPGKPPEKATKQGAEIQGPPEPDGSLLAVTNRQYVMAVSAIAGPSIHLRSETQVYWKLPDGRNGEFSVPQQIDSIAVNRDTATAALLSRSASGADVFVIDLSKNQIVLGPYFYQDAVSVSLEKNAFELLDSNGDTLRNIPIHEKKQ